MFRIVLSLVTCVLVVTGCASSPDKLSTSYVSPETYRNYSCNQIVAESNRIQRRVDELHASLTKAANADKAQMGVGLVLFWPTLLFLEFGDGPQAAEYSRLKGEADALWKMGVEKNCRM